MWYQTEPWTDWYVWTKVDTDPDRYDWEFNHTEKGHVTTDKPQPKHPDFKAQRQWANKTWRRVHMHRVGL